MVFANRLVCVCVCVCLPRKSQEQAGENCFWGRAERESVNFQHTNARARAGRAILIDAGAGEKEEKLFAQLVYWQIQFPDQR